MIGSIGDIVSWCGNRCIRPSRFAQCRYDASDSARSATVAIVRTTNAGSCPMAVSRDSMSTSVPSNTALATSLTSARVGDGPVIIDSNICVAVITGTPASAQKANDPLLQVRYVLVRIVDAEITTGDHHHIAGGDDLMKLFDRCARLDLRDQLCTSTDNCSYLIDVVGGPDERHGNELDPGCRDGLGQQEIFSGHLSSETLRRQVNPRRPLASPPFSS